MLVKNRKVARRLKIRRSIRKKVKGTASKPRLSVYKSNKAIYAQLIDDVKGHTLLSTSSNLLETPGIDQAKAQKVGEVIAQQAIEKGIETVVFDRSGYVYHGRVKALAEGARTKGLKF